MTQQVLTPKLKERLNQYLVYMNDFDYFRENNLIRFSQGYISIIELYIEQNYYIKNSELLNRLEQEYKEYIKHLETYEQLLERTWRKD
jgi:demethoxyubiquinone hydroxylase (CLK1/Coq7/Cat5 family)